MVDFWQRFRVEHPCPVYGRHAGLPQGKGRRCYAFLSADREYARCTREKYAAQLELNATVGLLASRRSRTALDLMSRRDAPPSPQERRPSDDPPGATRDGEVTKVGPPKYICIPLNTMSA